MILNYQVSRSSPRERVKYLIEGLDGKRERVEVLDGDPELFVELAEKNPYSVKMHNFLISFAESREELMLKLMQQGKTVEELYEEIFSLLFPKEYYEREGLNILAVAHGDTDNYHIHLTVENYDYTNGKSLYVPRTKTELEFYRALEKYISAKYGLSFSVRPISTGKAGVEKVKKILEERKSYKSKTKDEVKEEITNHLVKLALTGEIRSREELIAYLGSIEGVEIRRIGKNYVSFEHNGEKYRLKGGIYDEERFEEVISRIKGEREDFSEVARVFEGIRRRRSEIIARRRKHTQTRSPQPIQRKCERIGLGGEESQKLDDCFISDRVRIRSLLSGDTSETQLNFPSLQAGGSGESRVSSRVSLLRERDSSSRWGLNPITAKWRKVEMFRRELNELREEEIRLLKQLDPEEVLRALGISDYRKGETCLRMSSPIREGDENPSFAVFWGDKVGYWVYYDYATGWMGSSIDLWMEVNRVDYVEAVKQMREYFGINLLEKHSVRGFIDAKVKLKVRRRAESKRQEEKRKNFTHRIVSVGEVRDERLLRYLRERGIKRIPQWLREIHYEHTATGRKYFGVAVKNASGAWSVRSTGGKYFVPERPGQEQTFSLVERGGKSLLVVEGLFDALSFEQLGVKSDILILNGVGNVKKFVNSEVFKRYSSVILALDNDDAGMEAEEEISEGLIEKGYPTERIYAYRYEGSDPNESLLLGRLAKGRLESLNTPSLFPRLRP